MNSIDKQTLLDSCQTGDILLYSSSNIISRAIEYFTRSKYSHVSMILKSPTYIDSSLTGLYIVESAKEDIPDSLTGKKIMGVQIIPLEDALDYYKNSWVGSVYYRKLNCERNETFRSTLSTLILNTEGTAYDLCIFDWLRACFDIEIGDRQITKRFWCSALVAYLYTELGFLEKTLEWSMIEPRQFSSFEDKRLSYINCKLKPEIEIVNL